MRLGWAHNLPYMGKYGKAAREDRRMGFAHARRQAGAIRSPLRMTRMCVFERAANPES